MPSNSLGARIRRSWNAFFYAPEQTPPGVYGYGNGVRPDRVRLSYGNERSIATAVYNRIAIDVSSISFNS